MGVWIGGIITYEAFNRVSRRDFPLTILTTGVNKKEIYDALRTIGQHYAQLVLCGYPPFVKDVVDDGEPNGVDWRRFDTRILCAAEAFSEDFRDYLMQKTGIADAYRGIMNIYGSADLGTIATEIPANRIWGPPRQFRVMRCSAEPLLLPLHQLGEGRIGKLAAGGSVLERCAKSTASGWIDVAGIEGVGDLSVLEREGENVGLLDDRALRLPPRARDRLRLENPDRALPHPRPGDFRLEHLARIDLRQDVARNQLPITRGHGRRRLDRPGLAGGCIRGRAGSHERE